MTIKQQLSPLLTSKAWREEFIEEHNIGVLQVEGSTVHKTAAPPMYNIEGGAKGVLAYLLATILVDVVTKIRKRSVNDYPAIYYSADGVGRLRYTEGCNVIIDGELSDIITVYNKIGFTVTAKEINQENWVIFIQA